MYEAVEVFVNIFQAFAITFYLIKCLGVKEGKNRKCAYITGVIVTVLYLEIMNRIIFFESVGVLIYLVYHWRLAQYSYVGMLPRRLCIML